ncbi:two-component sensor histidine kinase [Actinophytocola sp. S1-96]|uniref:histidine kinase n=2 Tax=Actinophytocola gossypii TaxID=2812003 RepID=A0ABT2JFJ8_9PSEU|nr:two-component sensor histidine kinase [Actinophytocola gossypii]
MSFVPTFQSHGTQLGGLPHRAFDALAVVAVALQCLPLAGRRRWPLGCLALASAGFAVDQLLGYHSLGGTGFAILLLSAGAHLGHHRRTTAIALTAAYLPLVAALVLLGGTEKPDGYVTFYLASALVWAIGTWLRGTRAAEADRRRRVAEETRAAERARIARELHDVVAHHVTAMVMQAEAARYLTDAPDRVDAALSSVTDSGRRAITDLRHLLQMINPDHGTGTAAPLSALVEQTRQAGQPVDFTENGTPAASTGDVDLVVYRVVQESLTNALKYAHGSRTSVRVDHGETEVTVRISTDGSGARAGFPVGSGRGLAGLRERVDVLGGEFSASPRTDGGFVVHARVPAGISS